MNVYRRYFDITSGELFDALMECKSINDKSRKQYAALLDSVGATSTYYVQDHKLVAMTFDQTPDPKVFKRVKNTHDGWYPKLSTKKGKELHKELSAISTMREESCLELVDLKGWDLFTGGRVYKSSITVIPSKPPRFLLAVPWYDENPEEIEKYRVERETGNKRGGNFEHLLWEPVDGMIELKEWECQKAISEWNESLKSKAA